MIFGLALIAAWTHEINLLDDILNAAQINYRIGKYDGFIGYIITALLVGGGSDGVFQLFKKLGIRAPRTDEKAGDKGMTDG